MSTYNGEAFVVEQLRSILLQLPSTGRVLVRDDGSSDRTVQVIEDIGDARIALTRGSNIGFARSFFELMRCAPSDADMYMLADQDDVWLPGKIDRAWQAVSRADGRPLLYCTATKVVDERLRPLGISSVLPAQITFINALTENMVTGCTVAMNRPLLVMADPKEVIDQIVFHDWWLFVVGVAFGVVRYDPVPTILYRQHASNHIGRGVGIGKYFKMMKYLVKRNWLGALARQVGAIRRRYIAELDSSQLAVLNKIEDPTRGLRRWPMLLSPTPHRASWLSEMLFRALLLTDWRSADN
ncbi:MAG: glycosyltransferase [Acidobacteriota bacterium]